MKVSIFQNMTSKTPLPGLLEGVADLIRSDKKMATFTQSYRQTGSKTFKRECPLGHLDCLVKIDPQTVLDACLNAIDPTQMVEPVA